MDTEIVNAIRATRDKAQYDAHVKRLLAQKSILAQILVKTVNEFKEMKPENVMPLIEGEPMVGIVPVEPGMTNKDKKNETGQRIVGINSESGEINEGLVRFDIIFYVRMKSGLSQIIVNIECQKDEPSAYKILNRAIFYTSRLISSQKERDFVKTNYDDIKQVFSIWICMNMNQNSLSHIHLVKDEMLEPFEWKGSLNLFNIVMVGITDAIPEQKKDYEMHRLIGTLLSSKLKEQQKLAIIEEEYSIPVNSELRDEVKVMCNLSDGIEEKAAKKAAEKATKTTKDKIVLNMYGKGYKLNQIAEVTEMDIADVASVIEKDSVLV